MGQEVGVGLDDVSGIELVTTALDDVSEIELVTTTLDDVSEAKADVVVIVVLAPRLSCVAVKNISRICPAAVTKKSDIRDLRKAGLFGGSPRASLSAFVILRVFLMKASRWTPLPYEDATIEGSARRTATARVMHRVKPRMAVKRKESEKRRPTSTGL